MDLHNFSGQEMYFNEEVPANVNLLLDQAAEAYGTEEAEEYLNAAFAIDSENATVQVALYRYYYYQHRLEDALIIAAIVLDKTARDLGFPKDWQQLDFDYFASGLMVSFTKVRFYLLALKGAAYLNLRLGNMNTGIAMLNKILELDKNDRLGARSLLNSIGPLELDDIRPAQHSNAT